ncbi:MAG: ATP-binding cassette domain-containing protein [Pseudomonadota bacterium]
MVNLNTDGLTARQDSIAGMPLPVAMNRLARQHGVGVDATDGALTRDYGNTPKEENLSILSRELGAQFEPFHKNVFSASKEDFPLIAMAKTGGALIILQKTEKGFDIEGRSGVAAITKQSLRDCLTGAAFRFRLNHTTAERLTDKSNNPNRDAATETGNDISSSRLLLALYKSLLTHHRKEMIQLVLAALLINLFMVALPLYIMSVYDRVIPHAAFESLLTLTVGMALVFGADFGLRYVKLKFIEAVGVSTSRRFQIALYRKLLFAPLAKRPKQAAPIIQAQQELDSVCLTAPEFLASLVADATLTISILMLIGSIGGAIVIAPIIGCFAVAGVIFLGSWQARGPSKKAAALKTMSAAQINETLESLTAVKANGSEHALLSQFQKISNATSVIGHQARHRARFSSQATSVLVQGIVVATLFLGVVRIDAGAMSIGALAATTILVGRAVMPVSQIVDQFNRLWTLKEVLVPAFESINQDEEKGGERNGGEGRKLRGAIRLQNVSYTHEETDTRALENVSLSIAPGEKIGVIGRNGGGKSTLLHLIPALYTPTQGTVLLDEYDARQFSARRIRQDVALMPQETVLFNAPLKDNIVLGNDDIDEEAFLRAVTVAGVDRFAKRHPKGFSMDVGPRGDFLSAGERQAVGLARTILRSPTVLLLDEPTSMMDHTAEGLVINALRRETQSKTLVITTHRLRLLELVDRVIVLEAGRVIGDGPRDQVLAQMRQPTPEVNRRATG